MLQFLNLIWDSGCKWHPHWAELIGIDQLRQRKRRQSPQHRECLDVTGTQRKLEESNDLGEEKGVRGLETVTKCRRAHDGRKTDEGGAQRRCPSPVLLELKKKY